MKAISIFISVFLITSCHLNDPRPENHRANVTVIDNNVCVILADSKAESLSSLSIRDIGHDENRLDKTFTMENAPKLYSNKCVPSFDFEFEKDKSYVFSINAIKINKDGTIKNGNSYSVTFSLWLDKGNLKAVDIN